MNERSLFNVACKALGLWLLFSGVTTLVWAFLASRFSIFFEYYPYQGISWMSAAMETFLGLLFISRSSWLTRFVFRLDGPLDEQDQAEDDVELKESDGSEQ